MIRKLLVAGWLVASVVAGACGAEDAATKKFLAANGLFQRELYKLAAEEYGQFLTENPAHAQAATARYAMAVCFFRMNDWARAREQFQQLVKDPQFKQPDEALLALAHCELSSKHVAEAVAVLDRLIKDYPKSRCAEPAAVNRAQALYMMRRHADAAAACQAFLHAYPQGGQRPDAMYLLALIQRDMGDTAAAMKTLEQLLAAYPGSPQRWDATLLLGQLLESSNKPDEAAAQYQKIIDAAPAARQGEGYFALGALQYRRGNYDGAIKSFSAVVSAQTLSQQLPMARMQLGLAQLAARHIGEARKTLGEVIRADPDRSAVAKYWLAQCDIAERKFDSALKVLDELAQLKPPPSPDRVAFDRAQCLMGMEKYSEAAGGFESFLAAFQKHAQANEALYYQAYCLHKAGQYQKSLEICRKVDAKGGLQVRQVIAENLFLLNRYDDAASEFDALLSKTTGAERLKFTVRAGQCAYFGGDMGRCITLLGPLAADPKLLSDVELSRALLLLGDALLQTGKPREAAAVLGEYAKVARADKAEATFKLAVARRGAGDDGAAMAILSELMKGPADSPWTLRSTFEFGQLSYKVHQPEPAAEALKKVLASNAGEDLKAPAEYLLAWIEFDARHYEPAAAAFRAMAQKYSKHALAADAMFYAGVALKEAGSDEKAVESLRAYLAAFATGEHAPKAQQLIASALLKLQKHRDAIATLSSMAGDPKAVSPEVLYDLGWSQQAIKDFKGAEQTYRRLLRDYSKSKLIPATKSELAEVLYQQGQYAPAVELLKGVVADASVETKTTAVALYRLGSCYEKLSQPKEAADTYVAFLARHKQPDELSAWAHYQAGVNFIRLNNLSDAQAHFEAALQGKPKAELAAMSLLKLGEVHAQNGQYEASEGRYQEFLSRYPSDKLAAQAMFGIGWSMENRKRHEEARQWYQKVVAASNSPTAARAQFQIGETYFAEGKLEPAATNLLAVADVYAYPEWSAKALLEAGRVFEQLKDPAQARKQYQQVVSKYKDAPEAALAAKRLVAIGQ